MPTSTPNRTPVYERKSDGPLFPRQKPRLGDFTADSRVLLLMAIAILVGIASVGTAWVLLRLITLCTNIAYFGRVSLEELPITDSPWGVWVVIVPVVGCLIIGLMARFGSEKIRGHGIPEAIEAILIGRSRISAKVAILKPLSSAISIGSGGPFGAEGPIIMTGGAVGSLIAQMVHLSSGERKALLVAGAASGMTAIFGTPLAGNLPETSTRCCRFWSLAQSPMQPRCFFSSGPS